MSRIQQVIVFVRNDYGAYSKDCCSLALKPSVTESVGRQVPISLAELILR
jgi:hypothetical protein